MSRTFRRKNIEKTMRWLRDGRKTNGDYTTYDYNDRGLKRIVRKREFEEDGVTVIECKTAWYHVSGVKTYRAMDERERYDRWRFLHGESKSNNAWSPSPWYRNNREVQHRQRTRQELIKYKKDPDNYEPIVFDEPLSCLWDWS